MEGRKKALAYGFVVYIGAFLYYLIYYDCGINLADEGWFINTTLRIMDGQVPFRDFYYYPPALNYVLALIFKLFGANILYERLLWVAVLSGSVTLAYVLSRKLLSSLFWMLPPLLMLTVPGPWHKSSIPFLLLSGAMVGYRYIERKNGRQAFLCGLVGGAALYFRLDTSGFIIIALTVLVFAANFLVRPLGEAQARRWLSETASLAAGVLTAIFPAMVFMGYLEYKMGALTYMLKDTFSAHSTLGLPFPSPGLSLLSENFREFFYSLSFYMPPLIIAVVMVTLAARYAKKGLDEEGLRLLLLCVLGAFGYNQTLYRTDHAHLLQSVQVPYILGAYVMQVIYRSLPERAPALRAVVAALSAILCAGYVYMNVTIYDFYTGTIGVIKDSTETLNIPGAGVRLKPDIARRTEDLVGFIQKNTSPNDKILVLPYDPMIYFLSGRKNATSEDGVFQGTLPGSAEEDAFISGVERSRVPLVVFKDVKFAASDESRLKIYNRRLYEYVRANYQLAHESGQFQVYIRDRG